LPVLPRGTISLHDPVENQSLNICKVTLAYNIYYNYFKVINL